MTEINNNPLNSDNSCNSNDNLKILIPPQNEKQNIQETLNETKLEEEKETKSDKDLELKIIQKVKKIN